MRWRLTLLLAGLWLGGAAPTAHAEVVMKLLVVNPSETEVKEFTVHSPLPPEIRPEHVLDADGLRVEFSPQTNGQALVGTVTLKPRESLTKRIVLEDVWRIGPARFADLRQETWMLLAKLRGTEYEEQGRILSGSITRRLGAIEAHQDQPFVSPDQHISRYRDNLKALDAIETELVSLRQLMVMAAVTPVADSLLGGAGAEGGAGSAARGGLSILATWRMIFIVLTLLGFVSLSFFLIWQRQLKRQLAQQAAEDAAEDTDALLTHGGGDRPPVGPPSSGGAPKTPRASS